MAGDVFNPQSLNRYAYVVNNPVNFIDPLGRQGHGPRDWAERAGEHLGQVSERIGRQEARPALLFFLTARWMYYSQELAAAEARYLTYNCIGCFSFQGNLYAQYVNTTFASFEQYADWRTTLASLPENQIYDAFWDLVENLDLDPDTEYPVTAFLRGITWNVQLDKRQLNTTRAAQGAMKDPVSSVHEGADSWYKNSLIETAHLVAAPGGAQSHRDAFHGVFLFPLHFTFEYLPSLFINPQSQIPKNTSFWKCSVTGGCHQ